MSIYADKIQMTRHDLGKQQTVRAGSELLRMFFVGFEIPFVFMPLRSAVPDTWA